MIKKFSKYLSDYFIKIGIVERKNKSWCQYVIEKKAIRLIFGMATLIFSLYIKKTLEIALFLIIFLLHSETHWGMACIFTLEMPYFKQCNAFTNNSVLGAIC